MERAAQLLSAALLRPVTLLAIGAGLVLSLTWAPVWFFPISIATYAALVVLTLRDRAFVRRAIGADAVDPGAPLDWAEIAGTLRGGPWAASLDRIATAERNLARELEQAPSSARGVLASTLAQVRAAARLGGELAQRLHSLDHVLQSYAGMNPELARREAADKSARAAIAVDVGTKQALEGAAVALEESARTAESLRSLHERTAAQLEGLAAVLESVAVRGVRLRVQSDGGTDRLSATLGAEVDAVRETLGVLESIDPPSDRRRGGV
jgi:hypothetical protein